MKQEFTSYIEFKNAALARGLEVFTYDTKQVLPEQSEEFDPVYVGIRQVNPQPTCASDRYIDIRYGIFIIEPVPLTDNQFLHYGVLFDTDEEFEDWEIEQFHKNNPGFEV